MARKLKITENEGQYGINAPFEVPNEDFMAIKLNDTNKEITGVVKYAEEFEI